MDRVCTFVQIFYFRGILKAQGSHEYKGKDTGNCIGIVQ